MCKLQTNSETFAFVLTYYISGFMHRVSSVTNVEKTNTKYNNQYSYLRLPLFLQAQIALLTKHFALVFKILPFQVLCSCTGSQMIEYSKFFRSIWLAKPKHVARTRRSVIGQVVSWWISLWEELHILNLKYAIQLCLLPIHTGAHIQKKIEN